MNLQQIINRLIRRRSYVCDKTTQIYESAKIFNYFGDINSIKIGAFTHVRGELLTFAHGGEIRIGDYCYIGDFTKIWSALSISIGDRVLISHNVNIFDNITHPISPKLRHDQFKEIITSGHPKSIDLRELPVIIQDDVLIGCMSIILRGVTIGKGAIISAGSVVKEDVPAYTIVEGNPANIVREIPENER